MKIRHVLLRLLLRLLLQLSVRPFVAALLLMKKVTP
jgi:hypothetical protein